MNSRVWLMKVALCIAYLRIARMPMAATHSPTLTAMTMMIAAARPVQHKTRTVISILYVLCSLPCLDVRWLTRRSS